VREGGVREGGVGEGKVGIHLPIHLHPHSHPQLFYAYLTMVSETFKQLPEGSIYNYFIHVEVETSVRVQHLCSTQAII
jgi:hypothetical protein